MPMQLADVRLQGNGGHRKLQPSRPLVAQSGHRTGADQCPVSGAKRTSTIPLVRRPRLECHDLGLPLFAYNRNVGGGRSLATGSPQLRRSKSRTFVGKRNKND
jgi:hypothetical protein